MLGSHCFPTTDYACLVRALQFVGTRTHHPSHRRIVSTDNVIPSVNLIGVMSLPHSISTRYNATVTAFHKTAQVWFDFNAMNLIIAVNRIYFPIVKQYGYIVGSPSHIVVFPWTFRIFGNKNLHSDSVDVREYVELSFMISDAGRPDALSVCFLSTFEPESGIIDRNAVECIAAELPVDKIL